MAWTQIAGDIDGDATNDKSGTSVSLSSNGTIVAIGAPNNDGSGLDAGSVLVYKYVSGSWVQLGLDIGGKVVGDRSGMSVSLSSDGTIVAIGAPTDDNGLGSGHVRVYKYVSGSWVQLGLDIDGEAQFDENGYSVSLSSDGMIVAIGAPGKVSDTSYVRVYKYSSGSWTKLGLNIDGEAVGDFSGQSVSLSSDGTIVAIGAPGNASKTGHTRVYKYSSSGGSWTKLGLDIDGEAVGDLSGFSVSLSSDGTIVAIGAPNNASSTGHVRVYKYSSGWTKVGMDIDGEAVSDFSGTSVSLSSDGTIVAIGAHINAGNGIESGHVRIYEYNVSSWIKVGNDINGEAPGDRSGGSVSLTADGMIVAIGARRNGPFSGHVRIYGNGVVPVCMLSGTLIRTDRGDIPIEELHKGDIIITCNDPIQVAGVGYESLFNANDNIPYTIKKDYVNEYVPYQDVHLSGCHHFYNGDKLVKPEDCEDLPRHNVDNLRCVWWTVFTESHVTMFANGMLVETTPTTNPMYASCHLQ